MLGTTLRGRYHILKKLGKGGFGETYLAEDRDIPGTPYCVVKRLFPQSKDPAFLQTAKRLFDKEAEILHRLNPCDRIPRLLAHFQERGEFYLVEDFIDGEDFQKQNPLSPGNSEPELINRLTEILEILAFVHQQQMIHRDIKPANLMQRRGDGKFFLIDFGAVKEIASLTVNSQGQTSVTVAIGTPGYMPSEQAAGNPKPSSDIYALGMVIIELITGIRADQLPKDSHSGEVCWQHLVNLSLPLAEVLEKMVRYDYRQRYASAIEVLEAIKNLDNMTVPTMPSSASPSQRTKIEGFHPILLVKRALRGEPPAIVNLLLMIVATTAAVLAVPQVQKWLPQEPIPRVQATEFKAYQNAEYQLKLNYPTSWEMDSKRNSITHTIVTFQIPEAELIVSVEDLSSQPKTFGQYTDNFMDQLAADIPNFAH
jgi:serine/threonine-protein kinase